MWEIRQTGLWEADLGSLDGAVDLEMRTDSSQKRKSLSRLVPGVSAQNDG